MAKNARGQDARLILQLAEMYRDREMQNARRWWRNSFWPESADDYLKVEDALGTPQNAWLRQVVSYWGMAAALVAQGTLAEQALLAASFSDELFEIFSKVHPFLQDLRQHSRNPGLLRNIEGFATNSHEARRRVATATRAIHCDAQSRVASACQGQLTAVWFQLKNSLG